MRWALDLIDENWGDEHFQNLLLHSHFDFMTMTSRVEIWDFRLRIADCGFMEPLRSIIYNGMTFYDFINIWYLKQKNSKPGSRRGK